MIPHLLLTLPLGHPVATTLGLLLGRGSGKRGQSTILDRIYLHFAARLILAE